MLILVFVPYVSPYPNVVSPLLLHSTSPTRKQMLFSATLLWKVLPKLPALFLSKRTMTRES